MRARRLQGAAAAKKTAQPPCQHAVAVLRLLVDNTHRTALSSMLKELSGSTLNEGYVKNALSHAWACGWNMSALRNAPTCGSLASLVEHIIRFSAVLREDRASIWSSSKSSRSEYTVLLWNIGVTDVTSPSVYMYN